MNYSLKGLLTVAGILAMQVANAGVTVGGNVFGGGKMADVTSTSGTTSTINVYASTITGSVFGGNDITGSVGQGTADADASAKIFVHDKCTAATTVTEVYGGGNGYYKYKIGTDVVAPGEFTAAKCTTAIAAGTTVSVYAADADVATATALATYTVSEATTYASVLPKLKNTSVVVGETSNPKQNVKLTSVYGGAKNADVTGAGSLTVNSGTITYAYAGNNVGGTVAKSQLTITGTKKNSASPIDWTKAGTDWGILEAYGGGNKVPVGAGVVTMTGGQVYMLFGGGNAATATNSVTLTFNCPAATEAGAYDANMIFGGNNQADMEIVPDVYVKRGKAMNVYGGGNAGDMKGHAAGTIDYSVFVNNKSLPDNIYNTIIPFFAGTDVMIDSDDDVSGLWVDNVYGGCRAANVDNSTYVRVTKAMHLGNVFGGCDIAGSVGFAPGKTTSATKFTTYKASDPFAKVMKPNSKDDMTESAEEYSLPAGDMVYASTYVMVTGGTVSGNIYGSGNGNYTYSKSGTTTTVKDLKSGSVLATFDNSKLSEPFVTSSRVSIEGGTVEGKLYGGGFNAELGHIITQYDLDNADAAHKSGSTKYVYYDKSYGVGDTLSRTSYLFLGKTARGKSAVAVNGNIFGGGCMSNVYGTMDIIVKDGTTLDKLFAGNDAAGHVMGTQRGNIQAHASGSNYYGTMLYGDGKTPWTSFNGTKLTAKNAAAYIRVEDGSDITTLFGGGNGEYSYTYDETIQKVKIAEKSNSSNIIGYVTPTSGSTAAEKAASVLPTMKGSWLDIKGNITTAYGSGNAADNKYTNVYITGDAYVKTAYAGGNAATVTDSAKIWVDCTAATAEQKTYNVDMVFGGNNVADMYIVPLMYLQRGKIGTVYGGGNAGDMKGSDKGTVDFSMFLSQNALPDNIYAKLTPLFAGTDVMVDSDYGKDATGKVTGTSGLRIDEIYGGCRAANVDNSSYIRLTHADYVGNVYGGCDIAGSVGMNPGKLTEDATFSTYVKGEGGFVPVMDPKSPKTRYTIPAGTDMLYSSTYILVTGGTVSGNIYGSGNGSYKYEPKASTDTTYVYDLKSGTKKFVAKYLNTRFSEPFVTSATLSLEGGTVNGDIYGGGYNAELGHVITALDLSRADAAHKSSDGKKFKHYNKEYAVGDTLSRTCYIYIGHTDRAIDDKVKLSKNVFGGGCLANVYGVMDIIVKKDAEVGTLYAGNDASGMVFGKGRGSVQQTASSSKYYGTMLLDVDTATYKNKEWDSYTGVKLTSSNAGTYIRVENGAKITNLYGGGNGDYDYSNPSKGYVSIYKKGTSQLLGLVPAATKDAAKPIQSVSFLDVAGNVTNVYGGGNAANVNKTNVWIVRDAEVVTAYGGGNAATVTDSVHIYADCNPAKTDGSSKYNVTTLFGGNNTAEMDILPTISLWCGKLGTVYGGCNAGDMHGHDAFALDFGRFVSQSWMYRETWILGYSATGVHTKWTNPLEPQYYPMFAATEVLVDSPYKYLTDKANGANKVRLTGTETLAQLKDLKTGLRIDNVYGGCRAANVDNSTYVRVTRVDHVGQVFGGNDIAGTVGLKPGTLDKDVKLVAYKVNPSGVDQTRFETGVTFNKGLSMINAGSYVCITGGYITGMVFGGGNGEKYSSYAKSAGASALDAPWCASTYVAVEGGTLTGTIYGGGNMAGVGCGSLKEAITRYSAVYAAGDKMYGSANVFVGATSRRKADLNITGVNATIFGGSRMSDIYGSVDVLVTKGSNISNLFLGNDVSGQIVGNPDGKGRGVEWGDIYGKSAQKITILADRARPNTKKWADWNVMPYGDAYKAYNGKDLDSRRSAAYMRIEDGAVIGNLYGGGNGSYTYTLTGAKDSVDVTALSTPFVRLPIPASASSLSDAEKIAAVKPSVTASWVDMKGDATHLFGGGKAATSTKTMAYIGDSATITTAYAGGDAATVTDTASIVVRDVYAVKLYKNNSNGSYGVDSLFGGNNKADMAIVPEISLERGFVGTAFAGGNKGAMTASNTTLVSGKTLGTYLKMDLASLDADSMVVGSIFGGGNQAGVTQSTYLDIAGGTITTAVYGGCNTSGTVSQNSYVNIHKTTIGKDGAKNAHVLFGGGYGASTLVKEDVYLTIDDDEAEIFGSVYGGGRQGEVNTNCNNVTSTSMSAGIVHGDIYGGAYQANVNGQIVMNITGTSQVVANTGTKTGGGNVFAANNEGGLPKCDIMLNYCAEGDCTTSIYGGGNLVDCEGNSEIVFTGGRVGNIYGGANQANVKASATAAGNSTVYLLGGEVCHNVYGGGRGVFDDDGKVVGGNVAGNSTVYVLDDRLVNGEYVIAKNAGTTTTASTGKIYVESNGLPARPSTWTEADRTSIKVGGNVFGGGQNGKVNGNSSVYIGQQ